MTRSVPVAAVGIIKAWEGLEDGDPSTVNLDPYLCPADVATIGWGHAIVDPRTGRQLTGAAGKARARELYPRGITMEEAEILLREDLVPRAATIEAAVCVPLSDGQFGALVSLAFNIGLGSSGRGTGFLGSTLLRRLNAGQLAEVPAEFLKWTKVRDTVSRGLTNRRRAEVALWSGGTAAAVEPENAGVDIRALQTALNDHLGAMLPVDGQLGPRTAAAIRTFQAAHGLVPDGIAGPKTRQALGVS